VQSNNESFPSTFPILYLTQP